MSDLTITKVGTTYSKTTGGEVLSNNKKLNQMNVTMIDVEPTVDTNAYTAGDLMFNPIKIENAVAVKGGSAILQSVAVANDDALTGPFDLVLTASDDAPGTLNNEVAGESGLSDANADLILGITSITNMVDVGGCSIGSKQNIGMVIKAESTTRDVYVWGIAQSTDNPTGATGYKLRFGIVQD
tara:strand:+ start:1972 stop:2520 length:549 start_codon:yes stop_codon:yes gene_type:complete